LPLPAPPLLLPLRLFERNALILLSRAFGTDFFLTAAAAPPPSETAPLCSAGGRAGARRPPSGLRSDAPPLVRRGL
jgi:hypothetical protein